MTKRVRSHWLVLVVLALGCTAPVEPAEGTQEVEFGIGDKADGTCDPSALLCWRRDDEDALRRYFRAQDDLLIGAGDDGERARALLHAIDDVAHKLTPEEAAELPALRARAAALGQAAGDDERASLVVDVHQRVAGRVATGYLSAHVVPLGASVAGSPADDGTDDYGEPPSVLDDPDVIESLATLRDSGPFGYVYALMMEHTGVLDMDVEVWNEEFPFSEPREDRVSRIIDRYVGQVTRTEILVNLESLIPYAGIPLSVSHGLIANFRIRIRMAIEIAAAYGIDIREGQNLLLVTGAVLSAMDIPELRGLFGGIFALPALAKIAVRVGGLLDPRAVLRRLVRRMVDRLVQRLVREGASLAARATGRAVAVGTGRQVLGYATLGLTMVADVVLTRTVTRGVGEHVDATIRPWGEGMLTENGAIVADQEGALCVARMMGAAALADGEITDAERHLIAAHMSRSVWDGGGFWPLAYSVGYASQAAAIADGVREGSFEGCLEDRYYGIERGDRMAVLSWLLTLFAVDGEISAAEDERFASAVDLLRGDHWFGDGDAIEDAHLASMRARIETSLISADPLLDDDARELLPDLGPADVITGWGDVDPRAEAALGCALEGC